MAAVDSSDTKKFFFSSQLDWGGGGGGVALRRPDVRTRAPARHVHVRELTSTVGGEESKELDVLRSYSLQNFQICNNKEPTASRQPIYSYRLVSSEKYISEIRIF